MPETIKKDDGRYSGQVRPWRDPETGQAISIMGPGQEPLISQIDQVRILAAFDERMISSKYGRSKGGQAVESQYLLTGLLRCAECGERMSRSGNSYRCQAVRLGRQCPAPGGAYRPALDNAVHEAWFCRLTTADEGDPLLTVVADRLAFRQDPAGVARHRSVLSALEDERSALSVLDQDYYVRRFIDRDRYLSLSQAVTRRMDGLRQSLERIRLPQIDLAFFLEPAQLQERWSAADVVERRGLLELAIREVRVNQGVQGRRFEPSSRLVIGWTSDRPVDG